MTEYTFTSPDISCNHCKQTIEGECGPMDGVIAVEVTPETKSIAVTLDESVLSASAFCDIVTELGYDIDSH